jgi:acyl dehydratase
MKMTVESILTDEMKSKIGAMIEPVVYNVEKGAIKRFAMAVGDRNPLYSDDEYAGNTRYGGIICPPGFFGWPAGEEPDAGTLIAMLNSPLKNILNIGNDAEFYGPIRPGDVLVAYQKVADIQDKSKGDKKRLFVVFESTFKNQNDQVVGKIRYNMMFV